MRLLFFLLSLFFVVAQTHSQKKERPLFTIDGEPTFKDEFLRVYNKNLDLVQDESQKDMAGYLELFIDYKLKVRQALDLELDKRTSFKQEFERYKRQLSDSYMIDTLVNDALVKEAYGHSKYQVKASHILLTVDENAKPSDTLQAYQRIQDIREQAIAGKSFAELARQYSQDPSARKNGGDLGYFSAFRMVYPFEKAAFSTAIGNISMPVRTQYGYHIIKVEDKRVSLGERTVAHIMLIDRPQQVVDSTTIPPSEERINELYSKLEQGENFEHLARRFSDDRNTGIRGGKLPRFAKGGLGIENFEEIAFGLEKPGDHSKPFKTKFGWHIVQLIDTHPILSYEEMYDEMLAKVKKDKRNTLIDASLAQKAKGLYTITRDESTYKSLLDSVKLNYKARKWWSTSDQDLNDKLLVSIDGAKHTVEQFSEFLKGLQRKFDHAKVDPAILFENLYDEFLTDQLLAYYRGDLANQSTEYANIVEEYRNGLLLFDLMQDQIWDKAKEDSLGLQQFYEKHKQNYMWKTRGKVTIATCTRSEHAQEVRQLLLAGKTTDEIKEAVNEGAIINVLFTSGTVEEDHNALPRDFELVEGVSPAYEEEKDFTIVKVHKVIPVAQKKLEETKGRVINDYQQFLEKDWTANLRKGHEIHVNERVFKKLVAKQKKKRKKYAK